MRGGVPEALRVEVISAAEGSVGAERDPHVPPDLRPVPAIQSSVFTFQLGCCIHQERTAPAGQLSCLHAVEILCEGGSAL
jgi:hypothetical protein